MVLKHPNRLPSGKVANVSWLETLKIRLDGSLSNFIWLKMSCSWWRWWSRWHLNIFSNPNYFMILGIKPILWFCDFMTLCIYTSRVAIRHQVFLNQQKIPNDCANRVSSTETRQYLTSNTFEERKACSLMYPKVTVFCHLGINYLCLNYYTGTAKKRKKCSCEAGKNSKKCGCHTLQIIAEYVHINFQNFLNASERLHQRALKSRNQQDNSVRFQASTSV